MPAHAVAHSCADFPFTLTVREALEFSGIPASTLHRLIRSGKIRAIKTGPRRVRILRDSLLAFLTGEDPR